MIDPDACTNHGRLRVPLNAHFLQSYIFDELLTFAHTCFGPIIIGSKSQFRQGHFYCLFLRCFDPGGFPESLIAAGIRKRGWLHEQ